jgi:hypothetical protein
MSYLDQTRIVFFGDFQADVSTVNNDVRHFDSSTFQKRFQELTNGPDQNGWWRPMGSNAYRLINCRVRSVHYGDGSSCTDSSIDSAADALIGGSSDRVAGKIVDLDPQWQMASQVWGLCINLLDSHGSPLFRGQFDPTGFRDIFFGRQPGKTINGQSASAMFQSVLKKVEWSGSWESSRILRELHEASLGGHLSIRLSTFGYYTRQDHDRFTLGTISGVIGPVQEGEPRTFIAGRRFAPINGNRSADGINFFDGLIRQENGMIFLDLSNAIPLRDPFGAQQDIGSLDLAILKDESIAEGQVVDGSDTVTIGEIPYRDERWLETTGGIFSCPILKDAKNLASTNPLAILRRQQGQPTRVAIRECKNGLHVRAEQFVHRLDPGDAGTTGLFARKYGKPLEDAIVTIALLPPQSGLGGGPKEPNPPKAGIPDINVPAEALVIPAKLTTNRSGYTQLTIQTRDPKNPRGYIDGQIYLIQYSIEGALGFVQHPFDFIVIHLRNVYEKVINPSWIEDISPILIQYGNLYPVMAQRIVDLTDYQSVKAERSAIALAFSLNVSDPNYMPVTRDLSAAKHRTIVEWLNEKDEHGNYILRFEAKKVGIFPVGNDQTTKSDLERTPEQRVDDTEPVEDSGGKVDFLRTLPPAVRSRLGNE